MFPKSEFNVIRNMGRPTNDLKEYRLNVRVNEETYKALENKAQEDGKTVSDLIREAIQSKVKPL